MDRLPLHRWIDEFLEGNFDASDVKTQIKAGWYDCFVKILLFEENSKDGKHH